jgi:acyl-CoA reductase-like NAD-dependent aldehyde dehydrogenase
VLPTLDALAWLAREGATALRPRALRRSWLQWPFRATRHRQSWEPHGVVGVVTPGNGLLFLALPQIAGALLAGNAVVWKPAPAGGPVALHVAAALGRCGVPPSVLQVVTGGAAAAVSIVEAGVDLLHFTGSAGAGLELYRCQAERGRPAILELSGRHTALVLAPANPERIAREILWAKRLNDGRDCVAVQLVLVERELEGALLAALARGLAEGPRTVRTSGERERLAGLVDDALRRGARLVGGGGDAAVLAGVRPGMRVVDEEIAGPVLGVAAVDDVEPAVAWINGAPGRLAASVWTSDVARARRVAARLDAGQVWINAALHPTAQPAVTLAARGASGFGATRGLPGLLALAQPRVVSETPRRSRRLYLGRPSPALADLWRATAALRFAPGLPARLAAAGHLVSALARAARGRP